MASNSAPLNNSHTSPSQWHRKYSLFRVLSAILPQKELRQSFEFNRDQGCSYYYLVDFDPFLFFKTLKEYIKLEIFNISDAYSKNRGLSFPFKERLHIFYEQTNQCLESPDLIDLQDLVPFFHCQFQFKLCVSTENFYRWKYTVYPSKF